jgi:hypothetical protein
MTNYVLNEAILSAAIRHSSGGWNPEVNPTIWIPAFAGMMGEIVAYRK